MFLIFSSGFVHFALDFCGLKPARRAFRGPRARADEKAARVAALGLPPDHPPAAAGPPGALLVSVLSFEIMKIHDFELRSFIQFDFPDTFIENQWKSS